MAGATRTTIIATGPIAVAAFAELAITTTVITTTVITITDDRPMAGVTMATAEAGSVFTLDFRAMRLRGGRADDVPRPLVAFRSAKVSLVPLQALELG